MNFLREHDVLEFFDTSILMPWYKKLEDFKKVFPRNLSKFQRNGLELVIIMDDDEEEKALTDYLNQYRTINWKVVINRSVHQWRNPSRVLNVGIRNASYKYILALDPETELLTDLVYQLRYLMEHYQNSFAIGYVIFADHNTIITTENIHSLNHMPYGSIIAEKVAFEQIGGYNETYTSWGCDDDDLRTRLELAGFKKISVPQAIGIHRESNSNEHVERTKMSFQIPVRILKDAFYPKSIVVNNSEWGREFTEICYHWFSEASDNYISKSLGKFISYEIMSPDIFKRHYSVIALIPVRNEKENIPDVLLNLDEQCDGIILLDDGSEDDTYESAYSEKLLLKVKSKYKGFFDDLHNRNSLLELAHLLMSDWFFFADADERFDERFDEVLSLTKLENVDTILFKMIHLWNDVEHYRIDLEDGISGIVGRLRMFKNKGFLQIISDKKTHFPAVPFQRKVFNSNVLIKNYGFIDDSIRRLKISRYLRDNIDSDYFLPDALLDSNVKLGKVNDLKMLD